MNQHYQGHLPDGSSIQRHSAGGLYPYVLFGQNSEGVLTWGYINPRGHEVHGYSTYEAAADAALRDKELHEIDFWLFNHGSILVLQPQSDAGRAWTDEHLQHAETQHWGRGIVIEPRYWPDIESGILEDGLSIR